MNDEYLEEAVIVHALRKATRLSDDYDRVAEHLNYKKIAHETIEHLKRRDNLASALHTALFSELGERGAHEINIASVLASLAPSASFERGHDDKDYPGATDYRGEFLCMFSNGGPVEVIFKIKDKPKATVPLSMFPSEIMSLIDPATGDFRKTMTYDDWACEVKRVEIFPITQRVVIHAILAK